MDKIFFTLILFGLTTFTLQANEQATPYRVSIQLLGQSHLSMIGGKGEYAFSDHQSLQISLGLGIHYAAISTLYVHKFNIEERIHPTLSAGIIHMATPFSKNKTGLHGNIGLEIAMTERWFSHSSLGINILPDVSWSTNDEFFWSTEILSIGYRF